MLLSIGCDDSSDNDGDTSSSETFVASVAPLLLPVVVLLLLLLLEGCRNGRWSSPLLALSLRAAVSRSSGPRGVLRLRQDEPPPPLAAHGLLGAVAAVAKEAPGLRRRCRPRDVGDGGATVWVIHPAATGEETNKKAPRRRKWRRWRDVAGRKHRGPISP